MKKKLVVKLANDPDLPIPSNTPPLANDQDRKVMAELKQRIGSRADTQLELDARFDHSKTTRDQERSKAKKLFSQTPVAESEAPALQTNLSPESIPSPKPLNDPSGAVKMASAEIIERRLEGAVAPRVDAFFEKNAHLMMSEAQRNYPELLEVARRTGK